MSAVRAKTKPEAPPANGQPGEKPRATDDTPAKASGNDRLLAELLEALRAATAGQIDVRLSTRRQGMGKDVARAFNDFMDLSTRYNKELVRVSRAVGRDGRTTERIDMGPVQGMWVTRVDAVHDLIDDLVRPMNEDLFR